MCLRQKGDEKDEKREKVLKVLKVGPSFGGINSDTVREASEGGGGTSSWGMLDADGSHVRHRRLVLYEDVVLHLSPSHRIGFGDLSPSEIRTLNPTKDATHQRFLHS
jgi:hypothetical protein